MDLRAFHELHHLGVNKTLRLVQRCYPDAKIDSDEVAQVVRECVRCKSIDPAPVRWIPGNLDVKETWHRIACDVTHYKGDAFLTLVDCGPSRFALWRKIRNESIVSVTERLEEIFRERGPPRQILMDNSTTFRSEAVRNLCSFWNVEIIFRCAYRPSGNGIVERNHRTVKRMAARSDADILRMVFWYNFAPRGNSDLLAPCDLIYNYKWRPPFEVGREQESETPSRVDLAVGDVVFVKPPFARCTTQWPRGTVTGTPGSVAVEVDGVPRHVADVRRLSGDVEGTSETGQEEVHERDLERRSRRERRMPQRFQDYIV